MPNGIPQLDCGASHVTDKAIKEKLAGRLPERKHEFEAMSFGAFEE